MPVKFDLKKLVKCAFDVEAVEWTEWHCDFLLFVDFIWFDYGVREARTAIEEEMIF